MKDFERDEIIQAGIMAGEIMNTSLMVKLFEENDKLFLEKMRKLDVASPHDKYIAAHAIWKAVNTIEDMFNRHINEATALIEKENLKASGKAPTIGDRTVI